MPIFLSPEPQSTGVSLPATMAACSAARNSSSSSTPLSRYFSSSASSVSATASHRRVARRFGAFLLLGVERLLPGFAAGFGIDERLHRQHVDHAVERRAPHRSAGSARPDARRASSRDPPSRASKLARSRSSRETKAIRGRPSWFISAHIFSDSTLRSPPAVATNTRPSTARMRRESVGQKRADNPACRRG